jgi:hypothetical protein
MENILDYRVLQKQWERLIRGFEPLQDAEEFGRELIPLVREEVARRARANRVAV